jgi:hypothetical protein
LAVFGAPGGAGGKEGSQVDEIRVAVVKTRLDEMNA